MGIFFLSGSRHYMDGNSGFHAPQRRGHYSRVRHGLLANYAFKLTISMRVDRGRVLHSSHGKKVIYTKRNSQLWPDQDYR